LKKFEAIFATLDVNKGQVLGEVNYLAQKHSSRAAAQSQSAISSAKEEANENTRYIPFNQIE
jgi:hypothetical protein